MNATKRVILITIYKILVKGKKHYIQPSVDTIIDLICSYHNTEIHRRWAFQCLHDLEELGYINRRTRHIKQPDNSISQIPSLITITLAGARILYSQGVEGAARLIKEILSWLRGNDRRWPAYTAAPMPADNRSGSREIVPIKNVLAGLGYV